MTHEGRMQMMTRGSNGCEGIAPTSVMWRINIPYRPMCLLTSSRTAHWGMVQNNQLGNYKHKTIKDYHKKTSILMIISVFLSAITCCKCKVLIYDGSRVNLARDLSISVTRCRHLSLHSGYLANIIFP